MAKRSKTDHMRAKEEKVFLGQKEFTIKPKTNGELIELMEGIQKDWDGALKLDTEDSKLLEIISTEPAKYINKIVDEEYTQDDWKKSYPDDIAELVEVFKDINFTFLKKLSGPIQNIMNYLAVQNLEKQEKQEKE